MSFPQADGIDAVLFDFHSTLVDQGHAAEWIRVAWRHLGHDGDPADELGRDRFDELVGWADRIWERAREVDPESRRDLDPASHRAVYDELVERGPGVRRDLLAALYDTMLQMWVPYDDAAPLLRGLHDRGIRTALISNVGIDVREVLDRAGLTDLLDAVVLSYEVGAVKPDPAIFQRALELLDVPAARALMVGDSWRDDAGAAQLGIRTLVLPRTTGHTHGLDQVLRLVG